MPGFPFNFVLIIIAMALTAGIVRRWIEMKASAPADDPKLEFENRELRKEVEQMRERLHVLERITVEKENSLARQIDELKDR